MTHQEAIQKLIAMYPSQTALAKSMGISQQAVSNIKRNGVLPRKHWELLKTEQTVNKYTTPKSTNVIDIEELTLSQARALYEKLKEVFK